MDKYKYLGVIFHEKLDFSFTADALAKGAGRALGGIISKIHSLKEFGFKTFEKVYYACVVPILDYGSSVWEYKPMFRLTMFKTEQCSISWGSIDSPQT